MKENAFSEIVMKPLVIAVLFSVFISFFPGGIPLACAGEPTDQVKQTIDKVLDILKDKELKNPGKEKERRIALRKEVDKRFDFEQMSMRTLALHWKKRTPEEKKEFASLFSDLLERAYINKIESYTNEKIVYTGEKIEGDYALVKTNVITERNVDIPIEYRLIKEDGQWMAYDVVIEGVSLVNNYRNQFNGIIRSSSYEELVRRLKNKEIEATAGLPKER